MVTGTRVQQQRRIGAGALRQFSLGLRRSAAVASTPSDRDLVAWAARYLPAYLEHIPCDFHHWLSAELAEMVEKRGTNLVVAAPRGSAKSTWVSIIFVLWSVCHHAEQFILIASETSEQAAAFLGAVKHELEENRLIAAAYDDVHGPGAKWTEKQILTKNGIRIRAIGAGGRIRGLRQREARPSLVIVDDPEGDLSGYSEALREKVRNWFNRAVKNVGSPITNFVVVGTMIHEECLVGHLATVPGWRSKVFRSVIRWPDKMDLWDDWERLLREDEGAAALFYADNREAMNDGAIVLWPERESILDLMRMRATGGRPAFLCEKQNEPIPPRAVRFNTEWFDGDDLWYDGPPEGSVCFAAVDPCVGKPKTQGDLAAVVWCFWKRGDRHLYIDAELGRRPASETNALVVDLAALYRFQFVTFESNGLQGELGMDLANRLVAAGVMVPVIPIEHTTPKLKRIEQLGPYLQGRNFKFRRRSAGSVALVKALKYFAHPKLEPYDGPDALAMLLKSVLGFLSDTMRNDGRAKGR